MTSRPTILAIVGPTATGKTPLALDLAERLTGEIVSADSRQVYRFMDIGTAKPRPEDLRRIRHHYINILNPDEEYNAGRYGREARATIMEIISRGRLPILVGGSGLYIRAVIDGLFEGPGKDPELRTQLENRLACEGAEQLWQELRRVDPNTASTLTPTKPRRLVRALEVFYATGVPLSQWHAEQQTAPPFAVLQIGMNWPRAELYRRINDRVDTMFEAGLVKEVEELKAKGYDARLNALNSVGYREVFEFLAGHRSLTETMDLVKRNTRRFAKRQMTWFRADRRIRWFELHSTRDQASLTDRVEEYFRRAS